MMHQISQRSTLKQQSSTLDTPFVKNGHSHKILQSIVEGAHVWINKSKDHFQSYQKFSLSFHGKRYQLPKGVFWTGKHANQEELSFRGPSYKTFLRKRTKQACRLIGLEVNWLEVIADSLHCCTLGMFLKTLPHVETIWSKWAKRRETMPHTNIAIQKSL